VSEQVTRPNARMWISPKLAGHVFSEGDDVICLHCGLDLQDLERHGLLRPCVGGRKTKVRLSSE